MNKRYRFLLFLPLFVLVWTLAVTQEDTAADSSADDEPKQVELNEATKPEIRRRPRSPEQAMLEIKEMFKERNKSQSEPIEPETVEIVEDTFEEDLFEEDIDGEEVIEIAEEPPLPEWVKPVRWFRSNAAGMALEEVSSRFTALRSEYALVIDFINAEELPEMLEPFYSENQFIEVRALYHNRQESRRQWIFRDRDGTSRVVAVLREVEAAEKTDAVDEVPPPASVVEGDAIEDSAAVADNVVADNAQDSVTDGEVPASENDIPAIPVFTGKMISGFVEVYNERNMLAKDIVFSGIDGEQHTDYFYRKGTLVRAIFSHKINEDGIEKAVKLFTDDYRYNRSGALRFVERLYHEQTEEPVRLNFPYRVLDAAANMSFIGERLYIAPEFFGFFTALPNQRLIFNTDDRGRVLTQTLFGEEDEVVWTIVNNWKGDRITSAVKTQDDDIWLVEYEYDGKGKRIAERNLRNGVLERQVRAEGKTEVEELMMNGVVVLRAVWEDGRKVSEQRVRGRRERAQ